MDKDEAINIIARMFHSGEEIEGPDGLAMMVDMTIWNDACEALEDIVGDLDEPSNYEQEFASCAKSPEWKAGALRGQQGAAQTGGAV